jgi:hypothetical protein
MKPQCAYPNTQSASYAVDRYIREELDLPRKLTARPWNRFEPVNTEWWLIPSTEWPAYHQGKFFLRPQNSNRDLYCGLYVEKGLDPSIASAFPTGKKLVMKKDWRWHQTLGDMQSNALNAPLLETIERSGQFVLLVVDGGFIEDPGSYDPDAPRMAWNHLVFESDGIALRQVSAELTGDQFASLSTCESLPRLAHALAQIPQVEWTWIDVHIGVELEMAPLEPDAEPGPGGWGASELWERCLAPWLPWVV